MKKKQRRMVEREVIISYVCDKCGKKITVDDVVEWQEMFSFSDTGGYGSKFGDEMTWEIDICNSCFYELIGKYVRYVDR